MVIALTEEYTRYIAVFFMVTRDSNVGSLIVMAGSGNFSQSYRKVQVISHNFTKARLQLFEIPNPTANPTLTGSLQHNFERLVP